MHRFNTIIDIGEKTTSNEKQELGKGSKCDVNGKKEAFGVEFTLCSQIDKKLYIFFIKTQCLRMRLCVNFIA